MVQVQVKDKSPKRIIRQLLLERKGERDYDGMYAVIADWSKGHLPEPAPTPPPQRERKPRPATRLAYLEF